MLKRYPHTVQIVAPEELTGTDTGIVGKDSAKAVPVRSLQGRMELSSTSATDYKAIFYTKQSKLFRFLEDDKAKILWEGKTFNVLNIVPYQTHTEIWLH